MEVQPKRGQNNRRLMEMQLASFFQMVMIDGSATNIHEMMIDGSATLSTSIL